MELNQSNRKGVGLQIFFFQPKIHEYAGTLSWWRNQVPLRNFLGTFYEFSLANVLIHLYRIPDWLFGAQIHYEKILSISKTNNQHCFDIRSHLVSFFWSRRKFYFSLRWLQLFFRTVSINPCLVPCDNVFYEIYISRLIFKVLTNR
jgi:hypothetical protein